MRLPHVITSKKSRLLFILFSAALIRLPFVFLTPRWQAPDEYPHFHYIRTLFTTGEIPICQPRFPDYEAYQPPLYYLIGAGIWHLLPEADIPALPEDVTEVERDLPSIVIVLRLFSVILGVGVVYLGYKISVQVFPPHSFLIWAMPLLLALHPTFISNTTSITNDGLANFMGALLVWLFVHPNYRDKIFLNGLCLGLAFLTKYNLLPFAVLLVFTRWQERRSNLSWRQQGASILSLALLISVWFFLFNFLRYGHPLAIRPGVETGFAPFSGAWDAWRWYQVIRNYNWSFWCAFGRIYEIHLPAWFYLIFFGPLSLLMLYGAGRTVFLWKQKRRVDGLLDFKTTCFFLLGLILYAAAAFGFTASLPIECAWGKYVFPFLIPLWILMLGALQVALGEKRFKFLIVFLAASFIFMNMVMLWQLAHL